MVVMVELRTGVMVGVDSVKLGVRYGVVVSEVVLFEFVELQWRKKIFLGLFGFNFIPVTSESATRDAHASGLCAGEVPISSQKGNYSLWGCTFPRNSCHQALSCDPVVSNATTCG